MPGGNSVVTFSARSWILSASFFTELRFWFVLMRCVMAFMALAIVSMASMRSFTTPVAPSWAKGPKRVRGRGPRDTYG